jgi:hypothetical protein
VIVSLARARALAAAVAIAGAAGVAAADTPCTIFEIAATTGNPGAVDPDLKPLEKKLKKPPFSGWNTFHVQSRHDESLQKSKPEALQLKSGKASVMLRDRTDTRVLLEITVDDAAGKRVLTTKPDVPPGDWLVLGTNANNSDGHLLALTCK